MTFPTIPTVAAGRVLFANQADTSNTRTFPDLSGLTKDPGDLLIAIIVTYQSSTNPQFSAWGGGFTEFADRGSSTTLGIGCAYKRSTGSETGTFTVTQASTVTGHASMCLLSIPGANSVLVPQCSSKANGTTSAANPAAFSPTWGAQDTLWIAVDGNGMTSGTGDWTACGSGAPTGYSNQADSNTTDTSTVGQTEIAVSFRQLIAASEDRGPLSTHDLSNARNSACIIAVPPVIIRELVGTSTTTFSPAGGMTGSAPMDGSSAMSFSPAGEIVGSAPMAGSLTVTLTPSGTMDGLIALEGASQLSFSGSGELLGNGALAGSGMLAFGGSGALAGGGSLAGISAGALSAAGALAGDGALAGNSGVTLLNAGALQADGILAGATHTLFAPVAVIAGTGSMSGSSEVALALLAAASGDGRLDGSSSLVFTSSGAMTGGALADANSWLVRARRRARR